MVNYWSSRPALAGQGKWDKEEFAKLLNVEDIEEEEAELDSSISNPPDEP